MEKEPKVSIIVGCYNVAKWLRQGRLADIYNQTYSNWELILVDDGSTDETPKLLDAESKKERRIIVIHKKNGGLGSARNAGLDIATGKYVWSFDVDDHVEKDCIEYCVEEAEKRDVEVLMFGFHVITPDVGTTDKVQLHETSIYCSKDLRNIYLDRILFVPNGNGFFWNKFYRRSFIEKYNLRFGNQRIQQDEIFNLIVYQHLEKCYISPRMFYHYYIYNKGNNRSRFIPDRFDIYKSVRLYFEQLKSLWQIVDKRLDNYLNLRFYNGVMQCVQFNLLHHDCPWTKEQKKQELIRIISDPWTIEALEYVDKHYCSVEQKMYMKVCQYRNIWMLKVLNYIFSTMRILKRSVVNNKNEKRNG